MPIAASCTSGGTASNPAIVFRIRIKSVYVTSGMSAVQRDSLVHGSSNANAASDGIVYSTAVVARMTDRVPRCVTASSASGNAMSETEHECPQRQRRVLAQARFDLGSVVADPTPVDPGFAVVRGEQVDHSRRLPQRATSWPESEDHRWRRTATARGTSRIPRRDRLGATSRLGP